MSTRPSFLAELQRRHVYKVGAMYCVAGWLLVQVVTQVLPVFDVSALGQRILVLVVVAGLPVALVLAWLFDFTSQGIVRTADLPVAGETAETRAQRRGMDRKLNYVLGGLLAVGLTYEGLSRALRHPSVPATGDRSIAVLPFESLSDDRANAYFAEGIQEQVLTQLAKIGALRVISHASTQQYASRPASVTEIAAQLGVANILEGSVQRAGNAVRINVQLIRAEGDAHLWAETYDRSLDNIFGVESEVAEAIAEALNTHLNGAEKQALATRPTSDPAAWDDYLHATALFSRGESLANTEEAVRALKDAVQRDPGFAVAWAQLAEMKAGENIENWDTTAAAHAEALHAVQQAQRLRPDAAETQAAQAYYQFWVERDYAAARRGFELAQQKAPGNADILSALAFVTRRQGLWEHSLEAFDQALALDPRNVEYLSQAGVTAAGMHNYPLAHRYLDRALDVAPQEASTLGKKVWVYQAQGELDAAEPLVARLDPDPADVPTVLALGFQQLLRRHYPEGLALLRGYLDRLQPAQRRERAFLAFHLGEFQRLSGGTDAARQTYAQARDDAAAVLSAQPRNTDMLNLLALIQMRLGDPAAAREYSRRAFASVPAGGDALSLAAARDTLARLQAAAGDRDAALQTLQGFLDAPCLSDSEFQPLITPATLRLEPTWDGLRDDPRFKRLEGAMAGSGATG